jgi:UDP-glucose 4-epimerase
MLSHGHDAPTVPARAVVLGAGGFVGGAVASNLETRGVAVKRLGRGDIDLLAEDAADTLASLLRAEDALIVVSAMAPCKNGAMLESNIRMMNAVCAGITARPVDHIVYISSDAVYADSMEPMTEDAPRAPTALHGVMHLARELMLEEAAADTPLAIVRPTLIYGAADPHNGYGPNRFRRLAQAGEEIVLFGEGEELRDHVDVADVAELTARAVMHRSSGALNAATGTVVSFRDIAEAISAQAANPVPVRGMPRVGPMPHNGFRAFDARATTRAFPDFGYQPIEAGLRALMSARDA